MLLPETTPEVEAFMERKRAEWAARPLKRRYRPVQLPSAAQRTVHPLRAWFTYRDQMLAEGVERRSLRKREFLAGFRAASGDRA